MSRVLLVLACLLLYAVPAFAQVGAACVASTAAVPVVIGQSRLSFTSEGHSQVNPAGVPIVTDYFAEVKQVGTGAVATNFTVPKASVTPTGTIQHCYSTLLPAMGNLLPTATYTITVTARGPAGTGTSTTTTNPFFLDGAGPGVGNGAVYTPAP